MTPNWEELRHEFETTEITPTQLATKHGVSLNTVKSRRKREGWMKGGEGAPPMVVGAPLDGQGAPSREVPLTKKGEPAKRPDMLGNERAKGNPGNPNPPPNYGNAGGGAPRGNHNAVTHGFFQRYFPDDAETQALLEEVEGLTAVDMLWINIKTQFMAIIRAQKVMFVVNQDDLPKVLKKQKSELVKNSDGHIEQMPVEQEWEFQFAWDRHATYLTAQARAMSELRSLIKDFLAIADENDIRRVELQQRIANLEKTRIEVEKLKEVEQNKPTEVVVRRWSRGG